MFEHDSSTEPGSGRLLGPADHIEQLQAMIAAERRSDAVKFFLRMMGAPGFAIAIMRIMPFWPRMTAVANSLPYDAMVMGDFSLPGERIEKVQVPTLVLGGEKSQLALRKAVQETFALLKHGESRLLKGQKHNVSMKVLAPMLKAYFSP